MTTTPDKPQPEQIAVRVLPAAHPPAQPSERQAIPAVADTPSLSSYAWMLAGERWTILGVAVAVVAAALAYLFLATPVYRAKALVQIEARAQGLARNEEPRPSLADTTPAETEAEIVRSRTLVGSVVDTLGLDVTAEPRTLPIIGRAVARRYKGREPAPARLGSPRFGWGGERIAIGSLAVPEALVDVPLTLTATGNGRYRLEDDAEAPLLDGEVGRPASASTGAGPVALLVSELIARPGTQFRVEKRRRATVVDELREELTIGETSKKSGILVLSIAGPRPATLTAFLDVLTAAYLRQSMEKKAAEAGRSLAFVESQIPSAKAKLDAAQAALKAFQVRRTTVDLKAETSSMHERSVALDRALQDLELERAALRRTYTETHPSFAALDERIRKLREERAAANVRMRGQPAAEIDWAGLQRDVSSAADLHALLVEKAKALRLERAGMLPDARVVDSAAVPEKPESPRKLPVLLVAVLLGGAAGIAAALARRAFADGVEDPEEIEQRTGLPVHAVVLHSPSQPTSQGPGRSKTPRVLAALDPSDIAIENLRGLRTTVQLALAGSRNNVVSVSGPCDSVGKSFVCVNLAWVLASAERRVLLVDCDLRRGRIHAQFGLGQQPGVSDVLGGGPHVAAAVRPTENPDLDVLPSGRIPSNPAELLGSRAFERLLAWASCHYAVVVVDTPPVLAVTDPVLVARLAAVNLLVLRAGRHSLREIALTVKRFARAGVVLHGAVLNDVQLAHGRYALGRYHSYEFRADDPPRSP